MSTLYQLKRTVYITARKQRSAVPRSRQSTSSGDRRVSFLEVDSVPVHSPDRHLPPGRHAAAATGHALTDANAPQRMDGPVSGTQRGHHARLYLLDPKAFHAGGCGGWAIAEDRNG